MERKLTCIICPIGCELYVNVADNENISVSGNTCPRGKKYVYGAMAGIIGGGGLGKMAINYGYYNFKFIVMWAAVIGLILLVQIFQSVGSMLATRCDKRLRNRS